MLKLESSCHVFVAETLEGQESRVSGVNSLCVTHWEELYSVNKNLFVGLHHYHHHHYQHCVISRCLFLLLQIIPPGGNTSFDVVFLARVVGNVENTLFINTSHHGMFTYQVQTRISEWPLPVEMSLTLPSVSRRCLVLASQTPTDCDPSSGLESQWTAASRH